MAHYLLLSNSPKNNLKHQMIQLVISEYLKTIDEIYYIGSETTSDSSFFEQVKDFYLAMKPLKIHYFDFHKCYDETFLREMPPGQLIHFSTGNTFTFLKHIKDKSALERLKETCLNATLVVGTSAGAHLLCPHIKFAAFGDENQVELKDLKSLHLVNDFIIPHYERKKELTAQILERKEYEEQLYFLENGQGLLYKDANTPYKIGVKDGI